MILPTSGTAATVSAITGTTAASGFFFRFVNFDGTAIKVFAVHAGDCVRCCAAVHECYETKTT